MGVGDFLIERENDVRFFVEVFVLFEGLKELVDGVCGGEGDENV